jgi:outer membrane protein
MRKFDVYIFRVLVIAALLMIGPGLVQAQQVVKIGFINMEEIMATSDVGKSANEDFKKILDKNKKTIQDKERELQKLKDELEKQRPILTEQTLKEKEISYQKKFRDYQDLVKDANEDLNNRRQDMINKFVPDIMKIVNAIGEKEKYTMIVDMSLVPVAYANKENNLTKIVVEEFNKTTKQKK